MKPVLAWHWVRRGADGIDRLRDGRPVPSDGVWLEHVGPVVLCEAGLHASRRIIDALHYATGCVLCRVEVADAKEASDKLVGTRRRVLWRADMTWALVVFAELCAAAAAASSSAASSSAASSSSAAAASAAAAAAKCAAAAASAAKCAAAAAAKWAAAADAKWAAAAASSSSAAADAKWAASANWQNSTLELLATAMHTRTAEIPTEGRTP